MTAADNVIETNYGRPYFSDVISTNNLEDSYFTAALAAIAHQENYVESLIQNKGNTQGIYAIKMWVRGKPWLFTIDDQVVV